MGSDLDLSTHYQIVFTLAQDHKYSLTDIENLIPFERDIYLDLLREWVEERKQQNQ